MDISKLVNGTVIIAALTVVSISIYSTTSVNQRFDGLAERMDYVIVTVGEAQTQTQASITDLKLELSEKFNAVDKRFDRIEKNLDDVKTDVADLKTGLTTVKLDVEELKNNV